MKEDKFENRFPDAFVLMETSSRQIRLVRDRNVRGVRFEADLRGVVGPVHIGPRREDRERNKPQ
jgi:hypothetical protein